ncbi:MAG: hypothetical protein R2854_31035 [Caldilineaceae bacterium]
MTWASSPAARRHHAGRRQPQPHSAIQDYFATPWAALDSDYDFETLISNYSAPGGDRAFVAALVDLFNSRYGWGIGPENVALTNGSQTAFFFLFNMFAGTFLDGHKKILLPLAPEYIGYEDVRASTATSSRGAPAHHPTAGRAALQIPRGLRRHHLGRDHRRHLRLPAHQSHRQRAHRRRDRPGSPPGSGPRHPAHHRQRLRRASLPRHHLHRGRFPVGRPRPSCA